VDPRASGHEDVCKSSFSLLTQSWWWGDEAVIALAGKQQVIVLEVTNKQVGNMALAVSLFDYQVSGLANILNKLVEVQVSSCSNSKLILRIHKRFVIFCPSVDTLPVLGIIVLCLEY
jgi:hypothetical protein